MSKTQLWDHESFYTEFAEAFRSIAWRVNWSNSGEDAEDTEQWLWVHFYEIFDKVMYWSRAVILTHAQKAAAEHAKQEMLDYENFRTSFVYTTKRVDQYLRDAVWTGIVDCPDLDARADVSLAYGRLNVNRQRTLFRFYALKEEFPHGSSDQKTKNRAIQEIADILNHGLPTVSLGMELEKELA